jgi:hypothetical protein
VDGDHRGTDVFYRTSRWRGEPSPLMETAEVGWFEPLDLPEDALPWLARALRLLVVDGVWLDDQHVAG